MTKLILSAFVALALAGCAHGPDATYYRAERAALDTVPQYRGLAHQPPYQPGECLVLGRDDVWRQC